MGLLRQTMTPLEYQKRVRLQEARRLMWVDRLDVGSAGYQVGYQSPSQFSREYSRMFGVAPPRDLGHPQGYRSTGRALALATASAS